jgi:hypothetical protein
VWHNLSEGGRGADDSPMTDDRTNGWWTADEALGQHPDLEGATLVWQEYRRPAESWDHDHCAFCWVEISDRPDATGETLRAAFTDDVPTKPPPPVSDPRLVPAPAGTKQWVCPTCAEAYRHVFEWTTTHG